jgi:hypothetical protein
MQELVKAVATDEALPAAHAVGQPIHLEIWRQEMQHDLLGPSGNVIVARRELTGERCALSFTPAELGFYTLGAPRPLYAFGINTSADESDLRPVDKDALPKEFAADRSAHFVAGGQDYDELANGRPVFHWFLFAALGVLMIESGFQWLLQKRSVSRS